MKAEALSRIGSGASVCYRRLHSWFEKLRRHPERLWYFNDHMLKDIGLDRSRLSLLNGEFEIRSAVTRREGVL